jgi:hypothetical protein
MRSNNAYWSRVALWSAVAAIFALTGEHFIEHGRDLNAIHHWLSEYVLSGSGLARWLMRAVFLFLGLSALGVSMCSNGRAQRFLFASAGSALGLMMFFDSDPNDGIHTGMSWPLTPGNVHQVLLYTAIGGALLGMLSSTMMRRGSSRVESALTLIAIGTTAIQAVFVAMSIANHEMTRFGGLTERVVLLAVLAWVILRSRAIGVQDKAL